MHIIEVSECLNLILTIVIFLSLPIIYRQFIYWAKILRCELPRRRAAIMAHRYNPSHHTAVSRLTDRTFHCLSDGSAAMPDSVIFSRRNELPEVGIIYSFFLIAPQTIVLRAVAIHGTYP